MVVSTTIRVTGMDEFEKLPAQLEKVSGEIIINVAQSISNTLKSQVVKTLSNRGKVGVTGAATNYFNWRARSRPVGKGREVILSNPVAPYVSYLDQPFGPYPFPIDDNKYMRWLRLKGIPLRYYSKIKLKTMTSGHDDKEGRDFITDALASTMLQYNTQFAADVEKGWNEAFVR